MSPSQKQFLLDECFSLTLMATVQRGHVYREGAEERLREDFRRGLRTGLEALATSYGTKVPDADHLRNIASLAENLSKAHAKALKGGRFRIGSARKALNLYLKYLWCLGEIPTPPHCPFDDEVISRLREYRGPKWTKLETVPQYEQLLKAARQVAGDTMLAEWELDLYNDAQPRAAADAPQGAHR